MTTIISKKTLRKHVSGKIKTQKPDSSKTGVV